jgi:hypothetical protein
MLVVVAAHTVGDRNPRQGRIDTRTDDHRGVIKGVVRVSADDVSACLREILEMAVRTYQTTIERTTTSLMVVLRRLKRYDVPPRQLVLSYRASLNQEPSLIYASLIYAAARLLISKQLRLKPKVVFCDNRNGMYKTMSNP